MPAYKDKNNRWFASFYSSDSTGRKIKKLKRGFSTKRDALEWERRYQLENAGDLNMGFGQFVNLYFKDMENRIRENTLFSKKIVVETKILPFFENRAINSIKPKDILAWQNSLLAYRNPKGKPYSSSYLKSIHSQLSAIFNHAVRYYGLSSNPASKIGGFGGNQNPEMLFWTKEEYLKFSYQMMDKPVSYYAFEMLYWTGIRLGELLALTPGDFDFSKGILSITKSYQRLKGRDIITKPKTPRSIRKIQMPSFLTEEMKEYLNSLYKINSDDRIFCITKSYLHHELDRGSKAANVKRIRIHDLRHSHVSLLIDMGFSTLAIAERVGHESIRITYRYAHLFPSVQTEMADRLELERENVYEKKLGQNGKMEK